MLVSSARLLGKNLLCPILLRPPALLSNPMSWPPNLPSNTSVRDTPEMGQYWSLILCPVHWCSAQHFDGWEFHAYFMPVLTGQGIGDTGLCWGNACARAQVTGRVNVDNRDRVVEKSKASVQFQASTVSTIFHLSCHRYNVDLLIWYRTQGNLFATISYIV